MCAVLSLVASVSQAGQAQRVLGTGEDATVLPRGAARITAHGAWTTYNELYGPGGRLEQLGAPLSSDSLGAAQLGILRPLQTTLRELAALPSANVTLGPARTDFTARIARSAVVVDIGITSRLMITGRLPYEHTISEVVMNVNPRDELDHRANIGLNPALSTGSSAVTQNRSIVDSLLRAANDLSSRLAGCSGGSTDPVCASRPQVEALVQTARAFASGIATTYGLGADTARGAVFVPLAGSTIQTAIEGRVTSLNTSFKTYMPQLARWDSPFGARAPISTAQASELISETFGVAPVGLVERSHIGDVEIGAKLLIIDTFGGTARARAAGRRTGFRFAVGGLARLGTGQVDRPNELVDVGTGDGQMDIEANGVADFVFGRRLWASVAARFGVQLEDEQLMRIPEIARNPFAAAYREQMVQRDLGDYIELEASPRYVYNDYLSASLHWSYRRKGEDTYSGTFTVELPDEDPITLDASILGTDTEQTDQRVGGGATFSTLRAFDRGRANLPIELQFTHWQTMSGSGYVPKRFTTSVQLRYYTRLFGAPLRPRRTTPAAGG